MEKQTENEIIKKTYLYLDNYNEMKRYINEAVSEVSQIENADVYNISAERAFLKSIRECKAETVIMFEHINKSLDALKKDADAAGEGYKYDAFYMRYIMEETYETIAEKLECGKNTPKKWCKIMAEKFSIKLFGAKGIEK